MVWYHVLLHDCRYAASTVDSRSAAICTTSQLLVVLVFAWSTDLSSDLLYCRIQMACDGQRSYQCHHSWECIPPIHRCHKCDARVQLLLYQSQASYAISLGRARTVAVVHIGGRAGECRAIRIGVVAILDDGQTSDEAASMISKSHRQSETIIG